MYKFLLVLLLAITGCSEATTFKVNNKQSELSIWDHFSLSTNYKFQEKILRDNGSLAYTTYNTSTTEKKITDFAVHLYPSLQQSCTLTLIGASQTNVMGVGQWGKVDYYNTLFHDPEPEEEPPCRPPKRVVCNADESYCSPNIPKEERSAAYAFCADKDGKSVLICVAQMTDNPDQAKQIFETFRWTE